MKKNKFMFYAKIITLFLIPSLYTVVYLSSNSDPYGNMNKIPVAIINNDQGFKIDNDVVNVGQDVTDKLIKSNAFKFTQINAKKFSYDNFFMEIVIPKDFSKHIIDFTNEDYKQAIIKVEVDESKNYIFASIAQEALIQMGSEINQGIVTNYLQLSLKQLGVSIDTINKYNESISNFIEETNDSIDQIQGNLLNQIEISQNEYEKAKKDTKLDASMASASLNKKINKINSDINSEINNININFKKVVDNFTKIKKEILSVTKNKRILMILDKIEGNLNNIQLQINKIQDSKKLIPEINQEQLSGDIDKQIKKIEDIVDQYIKEVKAYSINIDEIQREINQSDLLHKKLTLEGNLNNIVTFFATPVIFDTNRENKVETYGEGLAAFFISLSLFVGALILMTVLPFEELQKEMKNLTLRKMLLFYGMFAIGQVAVLYALLIKINGLHFIHPIMFIIYSFVLSLFFIVLALILTLILKDIGKFIVFVLLILQLGASAGTFPIETAPTFFRMINPFLPMSYSVVKYREILFVSDAHILNQVFIFLGLIVALLLIIWVYVKKYNIFEK